MPKRILTGTVTSDTFSPPSRRSMSSLPARTALRSTTFNAGTCFRLKSSSCCVRSKRDSGVATS